MNRATTRDSSSVEARVAASPWRPLASLMIVALIAAVSLVVGKLVSEGDFVSAFLATATLAGIALFRYLGLPAWCSLLLVATVAARGPRAAFGLPAIADFLHYPIALLFVLAAIDRPPRTASRAPGRWLMGLFLVVLLSAIAHPDNPMRALLFLVIVGQPLAIIWAICRWGTDEATIREVGFVALSLAAIQLPIGVYQGLAYGWGDPVQGTLTGHGAGHHVLGALFGLGSFVIIAAIMHRRISPVIGGIAGGVCFAMMIATGSTAVTIIAAIAAVTGIILSMPRKVGVPGRRLGGILTSALLGCAAVISVAALFPGVLDRTERLVTDREPPEMEILRQRASTDTLALFLGSGPGTSASRASLLLADPKEGTPLEFLELEPTELGLQMVAATATSIEQSGGSAETPPSSVLAVIGDLGLVGFAALCVLLVAIWRLAGKSRSWLAPAVRCGILMVAALSLVDNWLEYPEFIVPFAILVGFVVSDMPDGTESPRRSLT